MGCDSATDLKWLTQNESSDIRICLDMVWYILGNSIWYYNWGPIGTFVLYTIALSSLPLSEPSTVNYIFTVIGQNSLEEGSVLSGSCHCHWGSL